MICLVVIAVMFFVTGFAVTLALRRWGLTGTSYPDQWSEKTAPKGGDAGYDHPARLSLAGESLNHLLLI